MAQLGAIADPMTSSGRRAARCGWVATFAFMLLAGPTAVLPALAQTASQSAEEIEAWSPIWLLEGTWEAEITGSLGTGEGVRTYERAMDGIYTIARHASVRLPQAASPAGDYHRELAVYSYDRERETIVLREFIVEGYVLQSTCETEPKRIVCATESVESGTGIRARLTLDVLDPYRFIETYELAFPGDELSVQFKNTWTRVPAIRRP